MGDRDDRAGGKERNTGQQKKSRAALHWKRVYQRTDAMSWRRRRFCRLRLGVLSASYPDVLVGADLRVGAAEGNHNGLPLQSKCRVPLDDTPPPTATLGRPASHTHPS